MNKIKVGILGATGMVGQRFVTLLENHPWFDVVCLAASPNSAGKSYKEAVIEKWRIDVPLPSYAESIIVQSVEDDAKDIADHVDLVFCALDLDKKRIKEIENNYAEMGVAVVSNNSAHRWTDDVPMIIPEVNPHHAESLAIQRKNRGWKKGLIAVKPNCSIQSYVAILTALQKFKPVKVHITSMQAISGAGKTFESWPEMVDNINPLIAGEEEKSEREPLKIWGNIQNGKLGLASKPQISATCVRVPVTNGHMASVSVSFENNPTKQQIIDAVNHYQNPLSNLGLPSAPKQFITYFGEPDRPQTKLDRDIGHGMGISMGRLREDALFDWKFISLSHNTIRGAAGGAILTAELLVKKGYVGI